MKIQGTIIKWNDDQGYGFIKPFIDNSDVFVHISAFPHKKRRPKNGDVVTYETEMGQDGRLKASLAYFSGEAFHANAHGPSNFQIFFTTFIPVLALGFVMILGMQELIPLTITAIYLVLSLFTFILFWADKSAATHGYTRTSEKTLLSFSACGGWPGALLAQRTFNHKTTKVAFLLPFWFGIMMNCAGLSYLIQNNDAKWVKFIPSPSPHTITQLANQCYKLIQDQLFSVDSASARHN